MAIATTVTRMAFNQGHYGTINLWVANTAGILPTTPLTVAGDLLLTPINELPNSVYKCEVIGPPRGKNRLIVRIGDSVTG
jgi:hypothetical protein